MNKICPVCHASFEARGNYHVYCSIRCRKIHHKEVYYDKRKKIPEPKPGEKILRQFYCKKCFNLVLITNEKDKRQKFCSPRCERLYWKHRRKDKSLQ